ncbi:MAG: hypothetical protein QOG50_2150 [Actinomycetota bacterium]|nr:hypothetical protein [Actinomycetota bacterium]
MVVGGGFFFIFVVIGIGSIVIAIMTAVDASKYPEWAFQQTGTSKFVWQILPIVLLFLCGIAGGVMGLIWFSSKRVAVAGAAQAAGPPPYGYVPPPSGGPQPAPGGWTPSPAPPPYPPPPPTPPPTPPPPYPPPEPPPEPSQ